MKLVREVLWLRCGKLGEGYVYTVPAYRRRGWGREVTRAWAAGMQAVGKIPFYSHRVENAPSLGATPVFAGVTYSW